MRSTVEETALLVIAGSWPWLCRPQLGRNTVMFHIRLLAIMLLTTTAVACKIDSLPSRTNDAATTDSGGAASGGSGTRPDATGPGTSQPDSNSLVAPVDSGIGTGTGGADTTGTIGAAGMGGGAAETGTGGATGAGGVGGSWGTGASSASTAGAGGSTGTSAGPSFVKGTCGSSVCVDSQFLYANGNSGTPAAVTLYLYVTNVGTDGVVEIDATAGSYTETKSFTVKAGASYIVEPTIPVTACTGCSFTYSSSLPGTPDLGLAVKVTGVASTGAPSTTLLEQGGGTASGGTAGTTGAGGTSGTDSAATSVGGSTANDGGGDSGGFGGNGAGGGTTSTGLAGIGDAGTTTGSSGQCAVANTCGSYTLSACCTDTQCRYVSSSGQNFPCDGADCTAAAQSAANWCLSQRSSSSPDQCQAFETCGSYTLSACCTDTQCRYLSSSGQNFPCDGSDCTVAAQSAANWCLSQ